MDTALAADMGKTRSLVLTLGEQVVTLAVFQQTQQLGNVTRSFAESRR